MESKIMQIFYGNDCLPYKDRERQVHYPITGNAFSGASLTTEIRFYVRDIGGVDGITWIANAKRADGKIAYKQLTATHDDDVNEYYVSLQLSQWFTEKKGDLFIALNGYGGGVDISVDSESGLYTVSGTPIIQATGSVKITIAYAPIMNNGYGSVPLVSVQEALGLVSSKLDKSSTKYIKLLDSLAELNSSSNSEYLNEGDIIAVRDNGSEQLQFYELDGTYPNFTANDISAYFDNLESDYAYINQLDIQDDDSLLFNEDGHTLKWKLDQKADKSTTYTKTQVDDLIDSVRTNEITLVNTTTYPTLSSFLSSTGQEGIIYLYPIEDEENEYYKYIWENNGWLSLGTTNFDFTQYYTRVETDILLNAKENLSNKTNTINSSSTYAQYPSAKAVYDLTQDIREVAEGKCQTFILSDEWSRIDDGKLYYVGNNGQEYTVSVGALNHFYVYNSETKEWEDKKTELANGDYDGLTILNTQFNSQNDSINLGFYHDVGNSNKYIIFGREPTGGIDLYLLNVGRQVSGSTAISQYPINRGDIFLVIETDVPDRWWANWSHLYKLETSKVDLTNYYTKNANLIPSTTETYTIGDIDNIFQKIYLRDGINIFDGQEGFGATIMLNHYGLKIASDTNYVYLDSILVPDDAGNIDIGAPSMKWKDIYFAGNLKGGATLTQAQYDALVSGGTVDSDTFYFIEEE